MTRSSSSRGSTPDRHSHRKKHRRGSPSPQHESSRRHHSPVSPHRYRRDKFSDLADKYFIGEKENHRSGHRHQSRSQSPDLSRRGNYERSRSPVERKMGIGLPYSIGRGFSAPNSYHPVGNR